MLSRCEAPKVMACTLYTSWAGSPLPTAINLLKCWIAGTAGCAGVGGYQQLGYTSKYLMLLDVQQWFIIGNYDSENDLHKRNDSDHRLRRIVRAMIVGQHPPSQKGAPGMPMATRQNRGLTIQNEGTWQTRTPLVVATRSLAAPAMAMIQPRSYQTQMYCRK